MSPIWGARASLHRRLSLATLVLLVSFLGLTGWLLSSAQAESLEVEIENRLLGQVYALLGQARDDADGQLDLPAKAADPRLNQPDSGLVAELANDRGQSLWRSGSLLGMSTPTVAFLSAGQQQFHRDTRGYWLLFGLEWESLDGTSRPYVLRVGLLGDQVKAQLSQFRTRLWGGLLLLGLLLLLLQGWLLRWGLTPLRDISGALNEIEAGRAELIEGDFSAELQPLADNLNSLIRHNRSQQDRFRHSLDDLAHSIKTPLALLQGALDSACPDTLRDAAQQAVPHIDTLVRGRLQRAAASGFTGLGQRVRLQPLAQRLINTLGKVYQERDLDFDNRVPEALSLPGNENDLMEMLGNLLDNACKYGHSRVIIASDHEHGVWRIQVEDDGPGIPADRIDQVLQRGGRLDEQQAGQGIGLASVIDLAGLYGGHLEIGQSKTLGGASINLFLGHEQCNKKT